ncbi:ArsR/SmtB family transcription factor [Nocardioides dilutus]
MLSIAVSTDDVAAVRFAPNAVWEAFSSIRAIVHPRSHLLHSRLDKLLPGRPNFDLGFLLDLAGPPKWVPDTLGPVPTGSIHRPIEQYEALRETDLDLVAGDLCWLGELAPKSVRPDMRPEEFLERLTAALIGYHRAVLAPLWDRVIAITEADIAHRRASMLEHGLGVAIGDLHEKLSYANAEIRVDMAEHQIDVEATGSGVWFVPSVFIWPWVSVEFETAQPVVSYAARGAGLVWERPRDNGLSLSSLIGRSRAAILEHLVVPRTTTWLADTLDLAPATVSAHLAVMSASGLLQSRKSGRQVLYARTQVADVLLNGEFPLKRPV